ncbi:MAG: hypothetical protein L0214_04370 [candidate division NC10 bacterium]|nr:hypothetical protein [candidate division NC10 bacterium]
MADPKDPHAEAQRVARLIVADIVEYNREKILEGIANDTLFEVLAKDIETGRKYYEKRVDPLVAGDTNYYELALVDVLVMKQAGVRSKIW